MSDTESLSQGVDELIIDDKPKKFPNFAGANADLANNESNEIKNQKNDDSNPNKSLAIDMHNISLKKELEEMVQDFKKKEILPDLVAELIMKNQLNTMNVDLYDYTTGYEVSFQEFGQPEIYHGSYTYAMSLIEYIRDGEIPYEIFDKLLDYRFKLYYDGYVPCLLRIHFQQEESMRTHFVLLQYTIQTIDAECSMKCKADEKLDFETERARLISHYSPDLCLDPNPRVAEIVISNELNQHPFITPYLKHFIQNEKARREKGVRDMPKDFKNEEPVPKKFDEKDWDFRSREPTEEEVELSRLAANMQNKPPLASYLKERKVCFPDKDTFTGFHVEIENFVYEYDGRTRAGTVESIQDKFCIGVLDDREFYYGAFKLDDRMRKWYPFRWWEIGNTREELDIYVNAVTKEQMKLCSGGMKITHNRFFNEEIKFSDGRMEIVRKKLENPVSQVVFQKPPPASRGESGASQKN